MKNTISIILILISFSLHAKDLKEKEIRANVQECKLILEELKLSLNKTYALTYDWVFKDTADKTPSKIELINILDNFVLDSLYNRLLRFHRYFSIDLQDKLIKISTDIQTLNKECKSVTDILNSSAMYEDPFSVFETQPMVEYGGSISENLNEILSNIELLEIYCNFLLDQKKIKPIIETNINNQNNRQLIVELFEICNVRDEIKNYFEQVAKQGCYYVLGYDQILFENGAYENMINYYYSNFDKNEIEELINFYKTPTGTKFLEFNGLLSLKQIGLIIEFEKENRN